MSIHQHGGTSAVEMASNADLRAEQTASICPTTDAQATLPRTPRFAQKRTGCLPLRRLRKTPMAHPHSRGRRASLITRHSTFCFDVLIPADGARACAGVADAPAAAVPLAPVEEVEESSEDSSNMIERPILGPGSGVGALKQRLKELGQPICRRRASRDRPPSR